jgi:hypothetical protein
VRGSNPRGSETWPRQFNSDTHCKRSLLRYSPSALGVCLWAFSVADYVSCLEVDMDSLYGKIPKDRLTLNAWIRSFHELNPIVQNAILFHATYSIPRFRICPEDPRCLNALRSLELAELTENEWLRPGANLRDISREYWKLGEVFPYLEWDKDHWSKLVILNPDYVFVKRGLTGGHTLHLRPDEVLRKIAKSTNPANEELKRSIPEHVLSCIIKDEYIPLDAQCAFHMRRMDNPYDLRGFSMVVSVIRDLLMFDAIREKTDYDAGQLGVVRDSIRAGLLFSPKLLSLAKERHAEFRTQVSDWMVGKLFVPFRTATGFVPSVVWQLADDKEMLEILEGA